MGNSIGITHLCLHSAQSLPHFALVPNMCQDLNAWIQLHAKYADTDRVFCNMSPEEARGAPGAALDPGAINQLLNRLAQKANTTGPHNPHAFRHAFARDYLLNGGDLASLSKLMGHENIEVTAT